MVGWGWLHLALPGLDRGLQHQHHVRHIVGLLSLSLQLLPRPRDLGLQHRWPQIFLKKEEEEEEEEDGARQHR